MSDLIAHRVRKENYLLEIFGITKDKWYINKAREIIEFVRTIYRTIEPSHYFGRIIIYCKGNDEELLSSNFGKDYYDSGMLTHEFSSIVFQLQTNDRLPKVWTNISDADLDGITSHDDNIIVYQYDGNRQVELFFVNGVPVSVQNPYSCPSIFALQYHDLNEALLNYHSKRIRTVSCELMKNCYADKDYIYLKNSPEDCMQVSLSEFLKGHLRGVDVNREFNLGASKPVDVRVYWKEANRSALIEVKWLGQSLNPDGTLGTKHSNGRVNDGMKQIKEYMDLSRGDNPDIITKAYLVVLDSRRRGIQQQVKKSITREEGFYYASEDLTVKSELKFWESFPDISRFFRMFVEPKCTL